MLTRGNFWDKRRKIRSVSFLFNSDSLSFILLFSLVLYVDIILYLYLSLCVVYSHPLSLVSLPLSLNLTHTHRHTITLSLNLTHTQTHNYSPTISQPRTHTDTDTQLLSHSLSISHTPIHWSSLCRSLYIYFYISYAKRTSSAAWDHDSLSLIEKRTYRSQMGYGGIVATAVKR